jgi:hypothetical protein
MEKSLLKKVNWLLAAAATLVGIIVVTASTLILDDHPGVSGEVLKIALTQEELVKRGAYLVNTSACHDCHSPKVMTPRGPEPDPARLLSGHPSEIQLAPINKEVLKGWVLFNEHNTAAVGPWGVSFSANISGDETGIGAWSEEQFLKAIKEGKYKGMEGSRSLLPPMPWPVYRNMTDEDLLAIFAYLKTTKPVRNIVPAPIAPDQLQ